MLRKFIHFADVYYLNYTTYSFISADIAYNICTIVRPYAFLVLFCNWLTSLYLRCLIHAIYVSRKVKSMNSKYQKSENHNGNGCIKKKPLTETTPREASLQFTLIQTAFKTKSPYFFRMLSQPLDKLIIKKRLGSLLLPFSREKPVRAYAESGTNFFDKFPRGF